MSTWKRSTNQLQETILHHFCLTINLSIYYVLLVLNGFTLLSFISCQNKWFEPNLYCICNIHIQNKVVSSRIQWPVNVCCQRLQRALECIKTLYPQETPRTVEASSAKLVGMISEGEYDNIYLVLKRTASLCGIQNVASFRQ